MYREIELLFIPTVSLQGGWLSGNDQSLNYDFFVCVFGLGFFNRKKESAVVCIFKLRNTDLLPLPSSDYKAFPFCDSRASHFCKFLFSVHNWSNPTGSRIHFSQQESFFSLALVELGPGTWQGAAWFPCLFQKGNPWWERSCPGSDNPPGLMILLCPSRIFCNVSNGLVQRGLSTLFSRI